MDALNVRMVDLLANQYNVAKMASKLRSDVSRPTDAFRNILCQVAQPCVSPSLISLRTTLLRNICLGGQICICNIVDAKLLNRARSSRYINASYLYA